jgi:hypothetical protein
LHFKVRQPTTSTAEKISHSAPGVRSARASTANQIYSDPISSILISGYVHFQVSSFEHRVAAPHSVALLEVGRLTEQMTLIQVANFEQRVAPA